MFANPDFVQGICAIQPSKNHVRVRVQNSLINFSVFEHTPVFQVICTSRGVHPVGEMKQKSSS